MQSSNILLLLIAIASFSGAWMYGHFIKNTSTQNSPSHSVDTFNKIKNLEIEIEQLKDENLTLRDLAHTKGDYIVDTQWIEWVQNSNGFSFTKQPQIIYAEEDEFLKSASTAWTENFSETGMIDRDYVFYAIGLTPQSNITIQFALGESGPGTRRAMFDYQRGCILVPNDFDDKNLYDKGALTQALSIALIEQNFPEKEKLNDDAWLARRIVIHGNSIGIRQAYMTQAQQRFQLNGAQVKPPLDPQVIRNAAIDFQSLPLYIRNVITAHAVWGRHFVDSQKQSTRAEQLSAALSRATSTLAILKNQAMPSPNLQVSEDALLSTSLGALGILFHAQLSESIKDPHALAKDLIDDQLEFFNEKNKTLVTNWKISFSSIDSAKQFAEHLKDLKPELKINVEAGKISAILKEPFLTR